MTVIFESPFWVGIFDRSDSGMFCAARYVFGPEPTEPELLYFALENFQSLVFSSPEEHSCVEERKTGFKRRMREVRKELAGSTGSTRAQQAIKKDFESRAITREADRKEQHDVEENRKFQLRQRKRAEKHRGH